MTSTNTSSKAVSTLPRISGSSTRPKVRVAPAPRVTAASSMLREILPKLASTVLRETARKRTT